MSDVGNRLKTLVKTCGFTNKSFAEKAEVAPNYISILIRTGDISDKFKYTIKKVIPNTNINWLETGNGEMLMDSGDTGQKFTKDSDLDIVPLLEHLLKHNDELMKDETFIKYIQMNAEYLSLEEEKELKKQAIQELREIAREKIRNKEL